MTKVPFKVLFVLIFAIVQKRKVLTSTKTDEEKQQTALDLIKKLHQIISSHPLCVTKLMQKSPVKA